MRSSLLSLVLSASLVSHGHAQLTQWAKNQVSVSICYWTQPRAALVRDIVYLDGGDMWTIAKFDDGELGATADEGNPEGRILRYNLSEPFNSKTNKTGILFGGDPLMKSLGGVGLATGVAQNMVDGGLLANNEEFFLFGGVAFENSKITQPPRGDEILKYEAYQYGPKRETWSPGFLTQNLKDGDTSTYIAYGGAANAPSENKAWYFSGLVSPVGGIIFSNAPNRTTNATEVSNQLITVDMGKQLGETWTNKSLPGNIKGRANPEVVWVPVGKEGILVVLGGVVYPEWVSYTHKSEDEDASKKESPEFMKTIDIYDVASGKWYQQETKDGPGTRTRGCAVVAPASDFSSFNIYYYGGYDGINPSEAYYDQVWVLSLPSFTWINLNTGTSQHARAGHKCFMPYPDQMMVFGGYRSTPGAQPSCLEDGPIVLFNTTSGKWMDSYDPAEHADYGVPTKVVDKIGGNAAGSATLTTPSPSGWATSALGDIFKTPYNQTKIKQYWPYDRATSSDRPDRPDLNGAGNDGGKKGGGSGLPKWVAPVLGVVLGLMLVTGVIVGCCLWRRRKDLGGRSSEAGTEDAGKRIISWIRGQPSEKAPTVATSEDTPRNQDMLEAARDMSSPTPSGRDSVPPAALRRANVRAEMADTQLHELADTSPAELHDTGLTPVDIIQKHSRLGRAKSSTPQSPGSFSFVAGSTDHASTISRTSGDPSTRPEHMRQLSEGTVSIESALEEGGGGGGGRPREVSTGESDIGGPSKSPISPPSVGDNGAEDYISAQPLVSPLRKSVFRESEEDMGKHTENRKDGVGP